ncbi:GNAT family N-acetyltransferase [Streptomyces roseus]|uniref:Acetyltransferase n=1 Tax=Streptomyces roseus TaxID=66430 RepID=A0A0J6XE55_9ACTN|nr:GNAT family N-acetyltransferase [Streptomyces roseus]KMO94230.1 acetyltransferase [Streptomyces roseus]
MASVDVFLRPVHPGDLPVLFRHMRDPEANRVAAFTAEDPTDRARFDAHRERILASPDVVTRTELAGGVVVGHAAVYGEPGRREVTYFVDRGHRRRGIATAALRELLAEVPERPLLARTAADNTESVRVLEKCGFTVVGRDRGFANARGAEIDELVLRLDG